MIVSPFTPLFFINRKADGIDSDYMQTFSTTDRILIELIITGNWGGSVEVFQEPGHRHFFTVPMQKWDINEETELKFATLSFASGCYSVGITGVGVSEVFRVTDDASILDKTTLIQYSMKNNRMRKDAIFFIDGMQYFFDFRVPGGFKDSNWTFAVDGEQFMTPQGDVSQLYGLETTQKRFTLGTNQGVPVWFGEMLNRILICSHVYFDGVKYSRKDDNVPELTVQLEGLNSFVFNQTLQQSVNLDPVIEQRNHLLMRRIVQAEEYRSTGLYNRITQ